MPRSLRLEGEELAPLAPGVGPMLVAGVLGVDDVVADEEAAALGRHEQVVGGQLVHNQEGSALAGNYRGDGPLPGGDIELKAGDHEEHVRRGDD